MGLVTAKVLKDDFTVDPFLDNRTLGLLSSYTNSEETTPLIPGDTSGATSQISVTGVAGDRVRYSIAKGLLITAEGQGTARGVIASVQPDKGKVTLVADTLLNRLNADVVCGPSIAGRNFLSAFVEYCGLVGITIGQVSVDSDIAWRAPILPGFVGNLWTNIKELCAAWGFQVYSTGTVIGVTQPGNIVMRILEPTGGVLGIDNDSRAQSVEIQNYNFSDAVNQVFFAADTVYSVAAGEVQEIRVRVDGTPAFVSNPTCVTAITPLPYTAGTGQYVVTDSQGYIVSPVFWAYNGGKITAEVSKDAADELIITITGANDLVRAPYRISEGGADRPALYITGYGAKFKKDTITLYTGDSTAPQKVVEIDNKFIGTLDQAYSRGVMACAQYGGPEVTLTFSSTPAISLARAAYTLFAPAANLLKDTQASLSRKTGIVEGWGGLDGYTFLPLASGGVILNLPAVASGSGVFRSLPGGSSKALVAAWVKANTQWLVPVVAASTYSAAFRLTRNSGTQVLKAAISWFKSDGSYLSTSVGAAPTVTTAVSHTCSVTAAAPALATYGCAELQTSVNVATSYNVENASFNAGTVTTPTAFVSVAEVPITSWLGSVAGAIFTYENSKYRVLGADYSANSLTLKMVRHVTLQDQDNVWQGKTFAQREAALGPNITFAQLAVQPLVVSP